MPDPLQIGIVVFPKVTQLDFTGPLQVFSSLPGATVHLIWKRIEPVPSDTPLTVMPTITFADCPQLDVICVPGGAGTDDMVIDEEMLDFLRAQAKTAKYITSVCTGSLVLGGPACSGDTRPPRTGRRCDISNPTARWQRRRAFASTATASRAAASPQALILR
jgi:putative intracellular protease/amidase